MPGKFGEEREGYGKWERGERELSPCSVVNPSELNKAKIVFKRRKLDKARFSKKSQQNL